MSIDRFESRFKNRSDLMDQITPNNVVQANVSVPAGEWKPAGWLPVVWQNLRSKDYFVMSSGKVVSFFADGRIVPSGLLERAYSALNGAHTLHSKSALLPLASRAAANNAPRSG